MPQQLADRFIAQVIFSLVALRLVSLGLAIALLAGCGSTGGAAEPSSNGLPEEIVIGAAIAKTGYMAPYDATFAAVEQLIEETNARGGIDGHKVRVIQSDTRSDPQQAVLRSEERRV